MQLPSFRLYKREKLGPNWYCRARVGGKAVDFSTGERERGPAEKRAKDRLEKRLRLLEVTKAAKQKRDAAKLAKATSAAPLGDAAAVSSSASASPAPAHTDPAAALRAKLKGLGAPKPAPQAAEPAPVSAAPPPASETASSPTAEAGAGEADDDEDPVEPDEVIPPGARVSEEDELFCDVLATGVYSGFCKRISTSLRKKQPPERAGEVPERFSRYSVEGLSWRLQKLIGNPKLGPDAKIAIGFIGTYLYMVNDAEEINPSSYAAAPHANGAPRPAPPAADPPPASPDETRALQPVGQAPAAGRFH